MKVAQFIVVLIVLGFGSFAYSQTESDYRVLKGIASPTEGKKAKKAIVNIERSETRYDCPHDLDQRGKLEARVDVSNGEWRARTLRIFLPGAHLHNYWFINVNDAAVVPDGRLKCSYNLHNRSECEDPNCLESISLYRQAPPDSTCEAKVISIAGQTQAFFLCKPQ